MEYAFFWEGFFGFSWNYSEWFPILSMMSNFPDGVYELISAKWMQEKLERLKLEGVTSWDELEKPDLVRLLAMVLSRELANYFGSRLFKKSSDLTFEESIQSDEFRQLLQDYTPFQASILRQVSRRKVFNSPNTFPDTPLSSSALLTGASRSPQLRTQLKKELAVCDRADWIVSFIKLSGILPLLPTLKEFTQRPTQDGAPRLRIATTTYLGATDLKAIEKLLNLPNTEIRFSYDTKRTRLHAKAYLFHRESGFSTAYVGSANISKVAHDEGLEWTAKISQFETSHLWESAKATFESHWQDETEFSSCSREDLDRLNQALRQEKGNAGPKEAVIPFFDLRPYNFQEEILQAIEAERTAGKAKHLIVAATGTGKTMIAAFDYRRFRKLHGGQPRLLFIAHREEILKQAQISFRQVLRDGNFGELATGRNTPVEMQHLFCTIQSWNSKNFPSFPPDYFDYVVLDEVHHAAATTYQNLIQNIRPKSLLGLTATPERQDGKNIQADFGSFTHEIRLPEAIDRALLAPFHYYGIPDLPGLDLSHVTWRHGKYDQQELSTVIGENAQRASWVLDQLNNYVANIETIKCLGFCVSIRHAEYMAEVSQQKGIKAIALTGQSSERERHQAANLLQKGELQIIYTVDLYNEGVDIPAVDTVLFLRPTESLTLFLQQLGRGLRLHPDKSHVTVLDYIAPQHSRFSYLARFRALSSQPQTNILRQLNGDMPFVPAGSLIQLEKTAKETILNNIKSATANLRSKALINSLQELIKGEANPGLMEILDFLGLEDLDQLYQRGLSYSLIQKAKGQISDPELSVLEKSLQDGFRKFLLMDDTSLLLQVKAEYSRSNLKEWDRSVVSMVQTVLWGIKRPGNGTLDTLHSFFFEKPELKQELVSMIDWLLAHSIPNPGKQLPQFSDHLRVHCSYSREQILMGLGYGTFDSPRPSREGVLHIKEKKLDVFFADIDKTEADFSPTTMYEDYAITNKLFHWQSQGQTRPESNVGQRYIHHEEMGYTPLLFIRKRNKTANRLTAPYFWAGPLRYKGHEGSKPISFIWELQYPLPAKVFSWASRS